MASIRNWQSGKTLSQSARFMFENQIATDVIFHFPNTDETVNAHRFVFMARSNVFYISYLDKPGETIEISDIKPAIFKEFIRYLYYEYTELSVGKALHLAYCAEKYEMTELKAECMDFLTIQVDETTVAIILDHAVLYNDDALISACRDIIKPLKTLSCLHEHHVSKDTLELVMGIEGLSVGEVDIFKFCDIWTQNENERMNIPTNASNRRKMLGPLLRKIPFCTHEQFATEVSGKHLLNGQEELQIFRYLCAPDKSNPPFPRELKEATKELIICVKLPRHSTPDFQTQGWTLNVFTKSRGRRSDSEVSTKMDSMFKLSISCSQAFKLLALQFKQAGNYALLFDDDFIENFSVHDHELKGYLKTPVQYEAGQHVTIHSIHPSERQFNQFTQERQVNSPIGPIELHINITVYGLTPFDKLLLQL